MLKRLIAIGLLAMALTGPTAAQSPFSPAVTVNGDAVTWFEIDQRRLLLELFRTPGDLDDLSVDGLIEDRLKMQEIARVGLGLTEEALVQQMEEFAGRTNLELDQLLTILAQNGIEEQTLRDWVEVGVSWRDYIRQRFGDRVNITEADIDQALGQAGAADSGIEILLNEIIMAAPPAEAERVNALARTISQTRSTAEFEAFARQYSALPSRAQGGRLDWLPISNYPPQLRGLLVGLAPGEVTPPIQIEGGVALLQLRDIREVPADRVAEASIDYAAYLAADPAEAARVAGRVDTCDDLYGVAQGLPVERLERSDLPPGEIAQDYALELAKLDAGEISLALTRGGLPVVLMLCARTAVGAEGADREAVGNQLRSERLSGYADALLADLRAAAVIVTQ